MLIRWLPATSFVFAAAAALGVAWAYEGSHGVLAALSTGVLLTVPGDLLRRVVFPRWRLDLPASAGLAVVGSLLVLVGLGAVLVAVGQFRALPIASGLFGVLAVLAGLAQSRRGLLRRPDASVTTVAAAIALSAAGLALFHLRPIVGDSVFLGQLETAVQVAQAASVPDSATAFGAATAFPTHYLFFDLVAGVLLLLGQHATYSELFQFSASLRLPVIGLFVLGFALAARSWLRILFGDARWPRWAAAALPPLLLLSLAMQGKHREPLAEGIGTALMGVGLWATFQMTEARSLRRRRWAIVAGSAFGLMVGVHLPATVAAAFLSGSWLVASVPGRGRPHLRAVIATAREMWPILAVPLIGLAVYELLGRETLARLVSGALENAGTDPAQAFRALLLMAGQPLDPSTPSQFLARYLRPDYVLVSKSYGPLAVLLLALGAGGVIVRRRRLAWRALAWILAGAAVCLAYVEVGPILGADTITPWKAIMRNAFYVWVPLAFLAMFGVASVIRLVTIGIERRSPAGRRAGSWAGTILSLAVVAAVAAPVVLEQAGDVGRFGWFSRSLLTPAGLDALRWLTDNTAPDSRILTPEVTFGSQLVAERELVTDGKGTLESPTVTAAAVAVLDGMGRFFLPARDPSVLSDYEIDYVLTVGDGIYKGGQFGGTPLLGTYTGRLAHVAVTPLSEMPYLKLVYESGEVRIFQVLPERLPTLQVDHLVAGAKLPPCRAELCLAYVRGSNGCSKIGLTTERDVCVVVRRGRQPAPP